MMRSQTARTESQQGREVKRVRNQGITKWTDKIPTDSCREVDRRGRADLAWPKMYSKFLSLPFSAK